ncbi:GPI transamidase component PIG-T isoform X2 [Periplaneta americana]|uniref:GPI transamidase component PIG-T isoform X2 n=1 Tax=Periplaneta americana TaxID=6978 RepID=UPI0037E98EAB
MNNRTFLCLYIYSFLSLIYYSVTGAPQHDYYDEELLLKPLPSGHVYAYFQFTTLWDVQFEASSFQHCHLFPRALGEIISRYNVQELHISLTEGLWRHETWGYPVHDAAPGAELWTWFKEGTENIDKKWKELTGALSGLLCVSLNFIDTSNSLNPEFTFQPTGVVSSTSVNSSYLRYATLPREIVCTENLTPWKKLLPCDAKKGLSTLLNAGYIHNTNYHSLGLHMRPVCRNTNCSQMSMELRQTVSLVYDMVILGTGNQDWSIKKLFGIGLSGACPLATMSNVYIDTTLNETGASFQLNPIPPAVITSIRGGYESKFAVYDIKALDIEGMFNIAAFYSSPRVYGVNLPPVLHANRYIVVLKRYIPGKARTRPYYLEVVLRLPPRSMTEISIDFDYVFLKWQEYPPDANHGFYIGAAVITAMLPVGRNYTGLPQDGSTITSSFNASRDGYLVQLRTETLIITLPTPDFSMPYNVICLACTVVALAFGPLHNITTKRLRLKDNEGQNHLLSWLKAKLKRSAEAKEKQS